MAKNISLEFANTVDWHAGPNPEERLTTYADAIHWAESAGVLSESQGRSLLSRAAAQPAQEVDALRRIVAFREAVYHIFSAISHDLPPQPGDVESLNRELAGALCHLRLVEVIEDARSETEPLSGGDGHRFDWTWTGMEQDLTSLLWPVARAASALLTSPDLARVRECADDACGWLFFDTSRNASRRWCDMADCGNRAKARRYRERRKAETEGES